VELACKLLQCVVTKNGTGTLSFVPFSFSEVHEESDKFPSMMSVLKLILLKDCTPSMASIAACLTKQHYLRRGSKSSGVYYFQASKDAITEKWTPQSEGSSPPYLGLRFEDNPNKVVSALNSLLGSLDASTTEAFRRKYDVCDPAKKMQMIDDVNEMLRKATYIPVASPIPFTTLKPSKQKAAAATSSPLMPRCLNLDDAENTIPAVAALNTASKTVLEQPETAQLYIDLGTYLARVDPSLMTRNPNTLSPPSKAARTLAITGLHLRAAKRHAGAAVAHASASAAASLAIETPYSSSSSSA
jgi:hypothetical protein